MLQCVEGVKHLGASLLRCCNLDFNRQSRGLEDPEILAGETVCMLFVPILSTFSPFEFEQLSKIMKLDCDVMASRGVSSLVKFCKQHVVLRKTPK